MVRCSTAAFFDRRPALGLPAGNRFLIPLGRAPLRFLEAQTERPNQFANVPAMVAHAEGSLDDGRDPLGRPEIPLEAVCLGSAVQQLGNPHPLLGAEPRLGPRGFPPSQCLGIPGAGPFQPLADGALDDPQCRSDRIVLPPLLLQLPCPEAPKLPIIGRCDRTLWCHTRVHLIFINLGGACCRSQRRARKEASRPAQLPR
jgi:hypothetical protein